MVNTRKDFLRKIGVLAAGTVVASTSPLVSIAHNTENFTLKTDNNTECDINKPFTISILQTTDVHCQINAHDELFWENEKAVFRKTGGYAHIATYLKNAKKKNPDTFIIDTGDMFQGSELSIKTSGKALVPILNKLNYDLFLPGNWEVVYGKKNMQTLLGALNAPKICANMYHDLGEAKKGELVFQPYHIWNIKGLKIGYIGYTDHLVPFRQSPTYSKGILYTKPEENLQYYVDLLRNQEQCAFVIIIAHIGLSQQLALANSKACEGVDYILGGDTHERVRKPIVCKYAKVVEPGAFGSFVGKLDLTILKGKVIKDEYELVEININKYKADKEITALIKNNEEPYQNSINKIVGYSTIPLYRYFVVENPIDTLILDALNWQMKDTDVVLSNGFRFCPPRTTADASGNIPITEGFIYDMLPIDSIIRTASITGMQMKEWLEKELHNVFATNAAERFGGWMIKFKGMEVSFNAFGPKGNRIKSVSVKGEALNPLQTYKICACERDGDPADMLCRIKGVANAQNTSHTLHSVIKDYLAANSPVTPTPPLAAKILDAPQTLLSQVSGIDYKFV